jgi:hypothetical protein
MTAIAVGRPFGTESGDTARLREQLLAALGVSAEYVA